MRATHELYKYALALLLALAGGANVWGQAVTGDRYESLSSSSFRPIHQNCSSEDEGYYGYGAHYGRYAVDDDRDTYWESNEGDNNDLATITLRTNDRSFNAITIRSASNSNNRPVSVRIESSDNENGNWTNVWAQDLNWNNREVTIDLPNSINAEYIRLSFERHSVSGRWGTTYYEIQIYDITFQGESNIPTIQHKPAKWHAQRTGNYVDDFSDDKEMFTEDDYDVSYRLNWPSGSDWKGIQAAHTIIDTIYVEKGSLVTLALPDRREGYNEPNSATNIGSYQRWYNFRTDGTFATGNRTGIVDLLTPLPEGSVFYRFANGYVNRPLVAWNGSLPSSMVFYYPQGGEDSYLVACDVSGYTDFSLNGSVPTSSGTDAISAFFRNNGYYEPTLTHRIIYQLIGVDNEPNLLVETYDINFPATILPDVTHEMVALSMDARSYVGGSDNEDLTVSIENDNAGITLFHQTAVWTNWRGYVTDTKISENSKNYNFTAQSGTDTYTISVTESQTATLSGGDRAIFFGFKSKNDDGTYSVPDGSTASIVVKKENGTEVARFNLTFRENSRLLSQTMVEQLENGNPNGDWAENVSPNRTPTRLGNQRILLTELNFDYEDDYGQGSGNRFYPFPLEWRSNTYGFYDGTSESGFLGGGGEKYYYPEYSSYSILNDYVEVGGWAWSGQTPLRPNTLVNSEGEPSTFHLYADASDRPGTIARLRFDENLCPGSVLYVSAWVKGARWVDNNMTEIRDNSAMLFTVMGVHEENGQTTYTPIYRHQTGQIPALYSGGNKQGLKDLPGINESSNQWYQTYFSFVNTSDEELDYDYYVLQVDNNSASTVGGDMYLDDIRVYISRPMAEVTQLQMACTDSRTLMNLKIDWDRFCQRVDVSDSDGYGDLGICFVDTLIFYNTYKGTNSLEKALNAAVVELGQDESNSRKFRMLHYYNTFSKHKEYDTKNPGDNVAAKDYYFYGLTEEDGSEYLSVDFYGDLVPNRAYWVVMVSDEIEADEETSEIINTEIFTSFYTDPCALVADFKVQGDAIIKVNGEIVTPETEFCRGNVHNFTVDLRVPVGDKYVTVTEGIYYDWFFGETNDPLTEYQTVNDAYSVSLQDALRVFRNIYPEAANLDDVAYGDDVLDDTDTPFTKGMYDIINHYLTAVVPEEGQNRPLVLRQPNLSITLLDELRVVVCPIPTKVPPEGLGLTDEQWEEANICWGYTYLELTTTSDAPTLHAGFNTTSYPEEGYDPALRIGLEQIKSVSGNNNNVLTLNLRGAKSYDPDNKESATLRRVRAGNGSEVDQQYAKIYLTDSDDPDVKDYLNDEDYTALSLPIGDLVSLEAHEYLPGTTGQTNEMKIKFDLTTETPIGNKQFTFNPKEGYYYTFSVYYEEMVTESDEIGTACIGTFPVTMKVVPKYLVWNDQQKTDTQIGNWNNDGNWKRATDDDINATGTIKEYADGDNRAFVPMLFSKVIMPRDSKALLYAAGLQENENGDKWASNRPEYVAEPTDSIQYDLMAYEQGRALTTKPYRVALCDEIHFKPGAEMLYAEYLLYNKAWVDYELEDGRWYTLASPLQGVVAGDFYTDKSGTEESEYFKDIPDFNTNDNNRFNPSVYQRGWKNSTTEVKLYTDGPNYENVAIAGNWSSLYNDVAEKYDPGTGFSLKVQDLNAQANGQALFRLPKADGSYSYYENGSSTEGNSTDIDRTDKKGNDVSGRLMSDKIYHRTETSTSYGDSVTHKEFTVTLSESANGEYYLVGNPFMAHLDMNAFLTETENANVLEPKYWYVAEDGVQNVVVTDPDGENTTWTNADANSLIPPLRSFFVKKKDGANGTTITFTHDMQALGRTSADAGTASGQTLLITATNADGKVSRAAVAYSGMASDDYRSGEDAELFLDSNLGDVPMVYTVAGTMATSINMRTACERVPLGVYGARDEEVTLRFEGTGAFSGLTLYDARTGQATALREGSEASVRTNDYGRYYLTGGTPTGTESVRPGNGIEIYSVRPGEVVVTSMGAPLREVRVYGVNGALVTARSLANQSACRLAVPGNTIYMIYAEDAEGIIRNVKMRVR